MLPTQRNQQTIEILRRLRQKGVPTQSGAGGVGTVPLDMTQQQPSASPNGDVGEGEEADPNTAPSPDELETPDASGTVTASGGPGGSTLAGALATGTPGTAPGSSQDLRKKKLRRAGYT